MDVKLVMFKRDGQRKDFAITNKSTTIGRGEDCTLQIPLLNVSRRHCELIMGETELLARDLASSNGTYVNNQRINEAALKAGDRLALGAVIFTVQIDGKPEQITPVKTKAVKAAEAAQAAAEKGAEPPADIAETAGESDPIAALEALASEHKKKKNSKK